LEVEKNRKRVGKYMKASAEWLEEYSDIDVDIKELGDILTMTGSKVETIESFGNNIKNVVVRKDYKN